jgi:hypothetical protein
VPARAFRNGHGTVELFASHAVTRRATGPNLESVTHQCPIVMGSTLNADPSMFSDREWIADTYILGDGTVMALITQEYQGTTHKGQCPSGDYFKCWFNSITLGVSHDLGATFTHFSPEPTHLVATVPYRYQADTGPAGIYLPSNILRLNDGYYYTLVAAFPYQAQGSGVCPMRTNDLTNPKSWRFWNGSSYSGTFIDPYRDSSPPEQHLCLSVGISDIGVMSSSLTYSTYLNKFVLVGPSTNDFTTGLERQGFYWSTSSDLIHWSRAQRLMAGEMIWSQTCGAPDPVLYPSLLDPASTSQNFETIGRRPDIFFTQFHYTYNSATSCYMTLDRDLIRIPLEFNKPPDCSQMVATPSVLPSLNRKLFPVTVSGATEPDGETMTLRITSVTQNQPVTGPGDPTAPDAMRGAQPNQLLLRAESSPVGAGRVYRINVSVADTKGGSCTSSLRVRIPRSAIDTGPDYDSFSTR